MGRVFTPRTVGAMLAALLSFALLVTGAPLWLIAVGSFAGVIVILSYQWRYTGLFDDAKRRWRDGTLQIEEARRQREEASRNED